MSYHSLLTHPLAALVLLAVNMLAVFRLTRLITADTITARFRDRLIGTRHAPGDARNLTGDRIVVAARPRLADFITCPWCVSPHLATGVVLMQAVVPTVWLYPATILAFSAVAGLLADRG